MHCKAEPRCGENFKPCARLQLHAQAALSPHLPTSAAAVQVCTTSRHPARLSQKPPAVTQPACSPLIQPSLTLLHLRAAASIQYPQAQSPQPHWEHLSHPSEQGVQALLASSYHLLVPQPSASQRAGFSWQDRQPATLHATGSQSCVVSLSVYPSWQACNKKGGQAGGWVAACERTGGAQCIQATRTNAAAPG